MIIPDQYDQTRIRRCTTCWVTSFEKKCWFCGRRMTLGGFQNETKVTYPGGRGLSNEELRNFTAV